MDGILRWTGSEGQHERRQRPPWNSEDRRPEVFRDVRPGQRFFYDDGELGGVDREVVQRVHDVEELTRELSRAPQRLRNRSGAED